MDLRRRIMLNEPHIVTPASAGLQTFQTDMVVPLKECRVHFSPVQEGTGDPSPENVRPITGWTGIEVTRCGRNLIGLSDFVESGKYISKQGVISSTPQFGYTNPFHLKSGRYVLTGTNQYYSNATIRIHSYNQSGVWQRQITEQSKNNGLNYEIYFDVLETDAFIRISAPAFTSIYPNLQLEYSSLPTSYELYSGTTTPIDWSDSGTIYGGYVDLVKGEVVQELVAIDMSSISWSYQSTNSSWFVELSNFPDVDHTTSAEQDFVGYCSHYTFYGYSYMINHHKTNGIAVRYDGNAKRIYIETDGTNTVPPSTNGIIVLKRLEPIRYPIDPVTLKTLRGLNNVWSNANGDIDLSYFTHK